MSIENLDAGAEGGEKTAEGWKYEEQICAGRWLLEEFQERVLRFVIGASRCNNHDLRIADKRLPRGELCHPPRILDRE